MTVSLDRKTLLGLSPINTLNPENLQELLHKVKAGEVKPGQILFGQGETKKYHLYVIEGEVELVAGNRVVKVIKAGAPESRHPLAHSFPRPVTARARTPATVVRVDSDLLDIMLTWDQTGSYSVEELQQEDEEAGMDWMTRILQTKALHQVPPANIQAMFMRMVATPFKAGDVVIRQGDDGDYFYIIRDGQCRVTRATPANPEGVALAKLGVGDSFGEEALISDAKRNATVTMITDGTMMRLSKKDFIELLNEPLLDWVTYEEALALVEKEGAQWLDVRLPSEYENNHITNALNIPLIFLRMKTGALDAGKKYIAYCDTGRRSSAASYLLKERGFDTFVLRKGLGAVPEQALDGGT